MSLFFIRQGPEVARCQGVSRWLERQNSLGTDQPSPRTKPLWAPDETIEDVRQHFTRQKHFDCDLCTCCYSDIQLEHCRPPLRARRSGFLNFGRQSSDWLRHDSRRQNLAQGGNLKVWDSKDTVRGYCLDIPRFEESVDNQQQYKQHSRNKVSDSKNG